MSSSGPPETFEQIQRRRAGRRVKAARKETVEQDFGPALVETIRELRAQPTSSPLLSETSTLRNLDPLIAELEGELNAGILATTKDRSGFVPVAPGAGNPLEFMPGVQAGVEANIPIGKFPEIEGVRIERTGKATRSKIARRARVEEATSEPQANRRRRAIAGFSGEVSEFNLLGTRNSVGAGSLLGSS